MNDTAGSNSRPLILIVADDHSLRLTLQDALERAGFKTALAPDEGSAVAGFRKLLPDLILLDPIMPGMDGFATCRDIRTIPKGKYTPILMITEPGDTESIHRAIRGRGYGFHYQASRSRAPDLSGSLPAAHQQQLEKTLGKRRAAHDAQGSG